MLKRTNIYHTAKHSTLSQSSKVHSTYIHHMVKSTTVYKQNKRIIPNVPVNDKLS